MAETRPLGPLMVDLRGEELRDEEREFLRHPAVGAVILFERNHRDKAQTAELAAEIKAARNPPPLIAVDQEGGTVQRLRGGFHELPAPAQLGELYDRDRGRALELAAGAGQLMAAEALQAGADFSFAPVLDCANARSRVIGARAFHRDADAVCELARAYAGGMRRAGMAATGKHFPGHGGVSGDSHQVLPEDARDFGEIETADLRPFAEIAPHLAGVMTAHVLFKKIDAQVPAYSRFWLQKILREKLQFNGVIFSDDLSMRGARGEEEGDDIASRATRALAAGCDFALICNAPEAARAAAERIGDAHRPDPARLSALRASAPAAAPDAAELARIAEKLAELPGGRAA
ncbi:MAG: beta-N-acetylhexosaminidase [Gammaproteobacteria bacterium]|nr:beta-N-acetylhexosaminidase [Gammaproteobacteria bacterium]MDA7970958.1 beta-N-acetylhexosaminidase [Gammaproteobacteria bacterium]MDA8023520.1 beta-N-acetylhexosaminidase [Gammaproteobacteria bacterium]CAJ2376521.1 MAG: Beta-hexosaminidase [Arenicellales bacterium IbO2]